MIAKKYTSLLALTILLAAHIMSVQAVQNHKQKQTSAFEKITNVVLSPKTVIAIPVLAFIAYSVVQGDIPFVDIPPEWLAYFDTAGWFDYFANQETCASVTSSICTTPFPTPTLTISSTITALATSTAAHIKSILESVPACELQEILQAVPQSVMAKIPGATELAQKVMNDVQSLSEDEISIFIESVKEFSASLKSGSQTLSFFEKIDLGVLYLNHAQTLGQFKAIMS